MRAAATEQAIDWLARKLAEEVPERGVDSAQGPADEGAGELVKFGQHPFPEPLDVPGVLPEKEGGDHLVEYINRDIGPVG